MPGILKIAYKLLVNDRAKFAALLVGITFAVFLMIQMTSLFSGVLNRSSATIINIGAKMWVMDPAVQTVANSIPMPDYVLDEVRSIPGVKYAVPLYSGGGLAKLKDGTYQAVNVMGLDDSSLFGRPRLLEGDIQDIFAENGFIVINDAEFPKLKNPKLGTEFELNDHRGKIVGIAEVATSGLFGVPTLYTTYSRALQYLPNSRFTTSYILVEPKTEGDVSVIETKVKTMGYLALTKDEFMDKISAFYTYQTGLGTNMLLMTVISFIVGLSISGQTFYTFIIENLRKVRCAESDRCERQRTDRYDSVSGDLHGPDRLRARNWDLRPDDRNCAVQNSRLRRDYHFLEYRTCLRDGRHDRRHFKLYRRPQGAQDRALRYFPGLSHG